MVIKQRFQYIFRKCSWKTRVKQLKSSGAVLLWREQSGKGGKVGVEEQEYEITRLKKRLEKMNMLWGLEKRLMVEHEPCGVQLLVYYLFNSVNKIEEEQESLFVLLRR